jgi:hypothetical protein
MKVYTVISKYIGYDERSDEYIGTYDSLETVIKEKGIPMDYIVKQWGSLPQYISWLESSDERHQTTNTGVCYQIAGEETSWGFCLFVYESELVGRLEHKFIN